VGVFSEHSVDQKF